jgi:anthranilate synthase component 2
MVDNLEVKRFDKVNIDALTNFDRIVFSPGPGIPGEYPIMSDILKRYGKEKNILGICLGHQAIVEFFGGKLTNLSDPLHGLTIPVMKTSHEDPILNDIPEIFQTGRYHSWAAHKSDIPKELLTTAIDDNEMVMSTKHKTLNIRGIQYHPESVMTSYGKKMLNNWIISC